MRMVGALAKSAFSVWYSGQMHSGDPFEKTYHSQVRRAGRVRVCCVPCAVPCAVCCMLYAHTTPSSFLLRRLRNNSQVPYKLGDTAAMKYRFVPCGSSKLPPAGAKQVPDNPGATRAAMAARLAPGAEDISSSGSSDGGESKGGEGKGGEGEGGEGEGGKGGGGGGEGGEGGEGGFEGQREQAQESVSESSPEFNALWDLEVQVRV